jgi:N-acetylglucosamine-6-phosphate deacetylase
MGAVAFTHLANGCPSELNRHDNILWRVLEMGDLMITVIPDQIHVAPSLFRLFHRLIRHENLVYVTDAMSAAGAPPGQYALGDLQLDVGLDQVVRRPGSVQFAGSALRPIEAPWRAAEMLGCVWQQTWRSMTQAPCRLAGLPDPWTHGQRADFVLLTVDAHNRVKEWRLFTNGLAGEFNKPSSAM